MLLLYSPCLCCHTFLWQYLVFLSGSEYMHIFYRMFIYVIVVIDLIIERRLGWNTINRFIWISNVICLGLFVCSMSSVERWWFVLLYWEKCWPLLFKLSFHHTVYQFSPSFIDSIQWNVLNVCMNSQWDPPVLCVNCMHFISPLTLWGRIQHRRGVLDTTLCDNVCKWLATGRWLSPGTQVSSTNMTDSHDISEMLLKVAFNTIPITPHHILRITVGITLSCMVVN